MQAIAHGSLKSPTLSPEVAREFVSGQSSAGLPEKVDGKKVQRDRQMKKAKKIG